MTQDELAAQYHITSEGMDALVGSIQLMYSLYGKSAVDVPQSQVAALDATLRKCGLGRMEMNATRVELGLYAVSKRVLRDWLRVNFNLDTWNAVIGAAPTLDHD